MDGAWPFGDGGYYLQDEEKRGACGSSSTTAHTQNKTNSESRRIIKRIGSGGSGSGGGTGVVFLFSCSGSWFIVCPFYHHPVCGISLCFFCGFFLYVFIITGVSCLFYVCIMFFIRSTRLLLVPPPPHTRSGSLLYGPAGFASMEDQGLDLAAGVRSKRFGVQLCIFLLAFWLALFCIGLWCFVVISDDRKMRWFPRVGGLCCCTACVFCFKVGAEGVGVIYIMGWNGGGEWGEGRIGDDVEFV